MAMSSAGLSSTRSERRIQYTTQRPSGSGPPRLRTQTRAADSNWLIGSIEKRVGDRRRSVAFGGPVLLRFNPRGYAFIEHVHRQRTAVEDLIVKRANVVPAAQLFFGTRPQLQNFKLAQFVAQGLGRPCDVAVHFSLHIGFVHGRMIV